MSDREYQVDISQYLEKEVVSDSAKKGLISKQPSELVPEVEVLDFLAPAADEELERIRNETLQERELAVRRLVEEALEATRPLRLRVRRGDFNN